MFDAFSLELTQPWWLATLVLIVPLLIYYYWRSLSDFPRMQLLASLATRCVVLGLLVLSLAGLTLLRPTLQTFMIIAIDQSLSVDAGDEEEARFRQIKTNRSPRNLRSTNSSMRRSRMLRGLATTK